VAERAAHLHRNDEGTGRGLPLRPVAGLRIELLALSEAENVVLADPAPFDAEDRGQSDDRRGAPQGGRAGFLGDVKPVSNDQERAEDQRRGPRKKESRVPPGLVRTPETVEEEENPEPGNQQSPVAGRRPAIRPEKEPAGRHEGREEIREPEAVVPEPL